MRQLMKRAVGILAVDRRIIGQRIGLVDCHSCRTVAILLYLPGLLPYCCHTVVSAGAAAILLQLLLIIALTSSLTLGAKE